MFCGQVLTAWMIDSTAVCRFSGGVDGRVCLGRRPKPLLAARARPRTTADEGQTCLRRCSGVESIIELRGACGWLLPRRFAGSAVDAEFRAGALSASAAPHAKWAATGSQVCCSRSASGSCRCVRSGAAVRVSPPGAGEPGTCAYRGPSGAGTPSCLHTAAASPGPISLPVPFRVCRGSADTCPSGPRHLACFAPPTSRQPFSRRCRSRSRRFTQRRTADARRRRSRCARQAPRRA